MISLTTQATRSRNYGWIIKVLSILDSPFCLPLSEWWRWMRWTSMDKSIRMLPAPLFLLTPWLPTRYVWIPTSGRTARCRWVIPCIWVSIISRQAVAETIRQAVGKSSGTHRNPLINWYLNLAMARVTSFLPVLFLPNMLSQKGNIIRLVTLLQIPIYQVLTMCLIMMPILAKSSWCHMILFSRKNMSGMKYGRQMVVN